jgi:hypothetical protein
MINHNNNNLFEGLDKIAGEINRLENGDIQITPIGEIGSAINNSLIFAQDNIYKALFPISSGNELESTVDKILDFMGLDKLNLSKDKYQSIYTTVFNSMVSYLYTNPSFELFEDVVEERNKLINGTTSIGYRIIELKKDPEFAKNGFLKNIEVNKDYKTNTYSISFKDPFGTESDDKEVTLGFYNLALDENNDIKQLAKDLALYPFATGDAGNIGRFIPIDYYMADPDFKSSISMMYTTYAHPKAHLEANTQASINAELLASKEKHTEEYLEYYTFYYGKEYIKLYKELYRKYKEEYSKY